jgi:hypothetical protein
MPKFKKPLKIREDNKPLPYAEFKDLLSGLTDEELNQTSDLLLNLRRKHEAY